MNPNNSVMVRFACRQGHQPHEICLAIGRGVSPELRCSQPSGISGGGGGCPLPENFRGLVEAELRDNFQECKRQGFVLVRG